MQTLAIIPARGGSKGIPLKNIQKLADRSLIEYTILAAKKSKEIDKIIVSTDSSKIAKISQSLGAEVPFLRPKKLSNDSASIFKVINHTLDFLSKTQSYEPDIISLLQPTSPLRTTKMIDESISILKKSKATCVLTVTKIKTHPYSSFWYNKHYLIPFKSNFQKYFQRQKHPDLYYPTGSIYTFWNETLKKYNSIYGPKIKPMIINGENAIDVDSKFDLFVAEMKILHWKDYNKRFQKYKKSAQNYF